MKLEKILIVTRKTRLQLLIEKFNTLRQAQFYIEMAGGDFSDYLDEHQAYEQALIQVKSCIETFELKSQYIDRSFLPSIRVGQDEVVVTLGQDGLVANVAKYMGNQPIIALNPDPQRIDGVLLPFHFSALSEILALVIHKKEQRNHVTLGEITLNDGQKLLAFNDFYIGRRTHVSSRYKLSFNGVEENHSSSGVIVSTGAGSTGWLSSVFNMAAGVANYTLGGEAKPITMPWEAKKLIFAVREPFASKHSGAEIVIGEISPSKKFEIESQMPQDGVIFSDGVEQDFLEFNSGRVATIRPAKQQAQLVAAR